MIERVTTEYKNVLDFNLEESVYHGDKTAISSSGLKSLNKSPKHFYSDYILGVKEKKESPALRMGSAIHMAVLEEERFNNSYRIMRDFGDLRKKENREQRDKFLNDHPDNISFISLEEFEIIQAITNSVKANKYAMKLLEGAKTEVSGYFRDPETGLKCKIRPDIFCPDFRALPDLKSTQDASLRSFQNDAWKYGYFIQMAFYSFGIEQITGRKPEMPCFIVVEKQPPFDCVVYAADEGFMNRGEMTVRKLLNLLSDCLNENHWPGYYPDGVGSLSLPSWTDWVVEI